MRALPTWRRTVVLTALTALLGMHGVSAGHEGMSSPAPAPVVSSMAMSTSILSTLSPVPSPATGLMATTCLALLGLGVALLLPRRGRLHDVARLAHARRAARRACYWPRGPDPVSELGISRT